VPYAPLTIRRSLIVSSCLVMSAAIAATSGRIDGPDGAVTDCAAACDAATVPRPFLPWLTRTTHGGKGDPRNPWKVGLILYFRRAHRGGSRVARFGDVGDHEAAGLRRCSPGEQLW
jgi:hypothetical protein